MQDFSDGEIYLCYETLSIMEKTEMLICNAWGILHIMQTVANTFLYCNHAHRSCHWHKAHLSLKNCCKIPEEYLTSIVDYSWNPLVLNLVG
jgi:hypothetical protein